MQTCMVLAGYDGNEADEVRSILGKKKVEKIGPAGEKFLARAVENGMQGGGRGAVGADGRVREVLRLRRYSRASGW